jgi:alpha-beta hydrolase superfamily lysophospholipase
MLAASAINNVVLREVDWLMAKRVLRWLTAHRKLTPALCLLVPFVALNAIAYQHARALTHFSEQGSRTASPESLSGSQKAKVLLSGVTIPRPTNDASPEGLGLTFERHRLASTGKIELEAWYIPHPQSKGLILMFHGYASCKAGLLPKARAFHELGYATFLVDFRGSGGSSGNETSIGVYEADDVARSWEYAAAQWPDQPLILYGQSMGSAAILRAVAVHGIRPTAMLLECPFDRLLSTVENRFAALGVPAFPGARLLVFWGGVQQGFNGFRHNPAEYAKKVEVPALIIHGANDVRATPEQVESVFENLRGPKRLELILDVGHEAFQATTSAQWIEAVSQFLEPYSTP